MIRVGWLVPIALLVLCQPVGGQGLRAERVEIHGFGGWSYGRTDVNRFLGADENGEYTKANFALKLGAAVHPTVQISAQINWRNAFDGSETSLDYAFADWKLANEVSIRAGKVKQPFGIYSEVAGIGTVRPFLNLPQAVYGPVGLISRSYRGAGLHGSLPIDGGWSFDFDVYGGGIEFEQEESALEVLSSPSADSTLAGDPFASRDVIGGRIVAGTPLDGLSIGVSAYSGVREGVPNPERYGVYGGQLEYLNDRLWLRGEIIRQQNRLGPLDDRLVAGYIELAAFLTDQLQSAVQYNHLSLNLNDAGFPLPVPADIKKHNEWSFGLNYWVQPELGFKASYHLVSGNLIAAVTPAEFGQMLFTGVSPNPDTGMLQFGVQFSF